MKKTIYIAGPMQNCPLFNFPAFDAARDKLIAEGWNVISPADLDRAIGFHETFPASQINTAFLDEALKRDVDAILKSDAIYMLRGWKNSTGATAEYWLAKWRHIEIIEQPTPKIIAFTGKAGSGKNLAASLLPQGLEYGSWDEIAFAGPLKSMIHVLMGNLTHSHQAYRDHRDGINQPSKEEEIPHLRKSLRQIMQTLGTEWGREMVCDDLWIQCFRASVARIREFCPDANIVVTDLRFPNEEKCIREMGGTIIRIVRSSRKDVASHKSEEQPISADHVIYNDGSLEDLKVELDKIINTK